MLNYKRIILGFLILIIGICLLFGVFWLIFFRSAATPDEEADEAVVIGGELPEVGPAGELGKMTSGGILPQGTSGDEATMDDKYGLEETYTIGNIANGSLTQVVSVIDEEFIDVNLAGNSLNYLSSDDNKFYWVALDGKKRTLLSDKEFPYVEEIFWSPDGKKVILEYPDGANIYYDIARDKQITLPVGVTEPAWRGDSDKIAYEYIGANEDDNWLVVSDSDGSRALPIEPIGDKRNSVQVSWSPTSEVVALYRKSIGLNREEIFFIGLNDENFKSLEVEGSNFKGLWSKHGDMILYHVVNSNNNYNPILWIADAQGDNIGRNNSSLGLSTWVDKCVFGMNNTTVYCAVPISLPEGAGLYPDLLNTEPDVFYKIDLTTGISKLIAYPVYSEELDEFQVKKIFLSDDGTELFFWDNFTSKLYSMKLR